MYGTKPLAKVDFTTSERCSARRADDLRRDIGKDAFYWYDTPWDLNCDAGTDCDQGRLSPAFCHPQAADRRHHRRSSKPTDPTPTSTPGSSTHRWGHGRHRLPAAAGLDPAHRPHRRRPAITLPKTTFALHPARQPARQDRRRLRPVHQGTACPPSTTSPAARSTSTTRPRPARPARCPRPETNTTRCYPAVHRRRRARRRRTRHWFNKYVVTQVDADRPYRRRPGRR